MSFTSIPILDLSLASDPGTKPAFLADLRHALMEVGFLYLKSVGIPDELFKEVIKEGVAFFDIPMEEKYAVSQRNFSPAHGFPHRRQTCPRRLTRQRYTPRRPGSRSR